MHAAILFLPLLAALISFGAAAQAPRPEPAGSRDHPLVGRYEGSAIRGYHQAGFDEVRVITGPVRQRSPLADDNSVAVAGRQTIIVYRGPEGRSPLEVIRNFEQTLAGRGFERLFECHRDSCGDRSGNLVWWALIDRRPIGTLMNPSWDTGRYSALRLKRAEGDVYVMLYSQLAGGVVQTRVEVIEVRGMEVDRIKVVGAAELKSAIDATGRIALYGILFDVDKADIKPESKQQIDAIIAYLRANPGQNVIVAGHTDNQGGFDYNVGLSQRRAQAVVRAISAGGIAAARLSSFGAGMASPVATNDTPEGQGRNRRVEIVKR
jgi:outer membrane protein OmpA-like peptidoglycan-associated protein